MNNNESKIYSSEHFSLLNLKKVIPYKMKPGRMNNKTGVKSPDMAYIDARQVMDLLDESVGMSNWQCEYRDIGGKMYCGIGIRIGLAKLVNDINTDYATGFTLSVNGDSQMDSKDRTKQLLNDIDNSWVWKWDMGTESDFEEEKGEASDAFKRAAVKWGIGRFLYDIKNSSKSNLEPNKVVNNDICPKCGSKMVYVEKYNKKFCSKFCWKKDK